VRYSFGCELHYTVREPTPFLLNVEVAHLAGHRDLREELVITPDLERRSYVVPGTENRQVAILAPAGELTIRYSGAVDVDTHSEDPSGIGEMPIAKLPLEVMPFLLPSRFVQSDLLYAFAQREFGYLERGHGRVTAICNWICGNFNYWHGSSNPQTTAVDTLIARAGVCRDFAHLAMAFCRALKIPARMVSAYAYGLQPSDFHAVFEAYLGGRWYLFDATRQAALDGIVRIGAGRDAADVAFAAFFGQVDPGPIEVWIEAEGRDSNAPRTTDAVSVSTG
jgi:transglutaminase-like putative cysteine protease